MLSEKVRKINHSNNKIQENSNNTIKITVLGNITVGKSSLIYRFINYNLPQEYYDTLEDRYKIDVNIENKDYIVEILDTGEDLYENITDMWISFGEGFLLVFAINDADSFEKIKLLYNRILKGKHGIKYPILLVGNKQDLENERKVSYDDAKQLADSWGIEYIETSAKTKFNYKEPFEKLAQKVVLSKRIITHPLPPSCIILCAMCNII